MTDDENEPDVEALLNLPAFTPDSIGATDYAFQGRPPRSEFLAWHRPRKQYVRDRQWRNAVLEIMSRRDPADRIKYLGLPGVDLLDIRQLLRSVCEPTGRKIQYIGFDLAAGSTTPEAIELNISTSELEARALVQAPSVVRPDDFRVLGRTNTPAWRAVRDFGPVDIVNLDLTTSLFSDEPDEPLTYVAALREVLALQASNTHPWVLLLTTRIDRESMAESAIIGLLETLAQAIADCHDLIADLEAAGRSAPDLNDPFSCSESDLQVQVLVGAMQWIRDLITSGTLSSRLRVESCFVYSSFQRAGEVDLASLVLRFSPGQTILDDPLYPATASSANVDDPCVQYSQFVRRVAGPLNIDDTLVAEAALRAEMIEQSADLLEDARYQRAAYVEWAETQAS